MSNGQGSLGNIVAAICSFIFPGLGQLIQGRLGSALGWFLFACLAFVISWILTLSLFPFGWFVVSVFSCINAALFEAPGSRQHA